MSAYRAFLDSDDISRESFESLAIGLDYGDGDVTGLAGVDIADDAGFACMHAADDIASRTIFNFGWRFGLLFHGYG